MFQLVGRPCVDMAKINSSKERRLILSLLLNQDSLKNVLYCSCLLEKTCSQCSDFPSAPTSMDLAPASRPSVPTSMTFGSASRIFVPTLTTFALASMTLRAD